jgi:acyl carrier protein
MNNFEKLKQLIADIFDTGVNTINEESSNTTIAMWDSIHQMNLIFAIEEAFDLHLSDEDVVKLVSVKEIRRMLADHEIDV